MPNPLPYLNENSLIAYPFKDGLSQTTSNGKYTIPNNLFVDAQFVLNTPEAVKVCFTSFIKDRPDNVTTQFSFVFSLYNTVNTLVTTETITIIGALTPFNTITYTGSGNSVFIKLVLGIGCLLLNDTNDIGLFTYTFNGAPNAAAEFTSQAVIIPAPVVTSVSFENYMEQDSPPEVVVLLDTNTLNIMEGTNMAFDGTTELDLSVSAGAGQGLYNGCEDFSGTIRTINDVKPNKAGDFALFTDSCYNTSKIPAGLQIVHTCPPKCSEEDITAFAYYLNRVKDGMVQLQAYLEQVGTDLVTQMTAYNSMLAALSVQQAPYIEVDAIVSKGSQKYYVSFAVGIYNPSTNSDPEHQSSITAQLSVVPDSGASFSYQPGTSIIRENGRSQPLTTVGFTPRSLKCSSSTIYEVVLYSSNLFIANTHVEFLLLQTDGTHPGSAYKLQGLFATAVYFTIKYNKVWNGINYIYKFTVDLFDVSASGAEAILFSVGTPSGLNIEVGSVVLTVNNIATSIIATTSAFSINQSIDITKQTTVTFEANASTSGSYATTFLISHGVTAFSRTVSVV